MSLDVYLEIDVAALVGASEAEIIKLFAANCTHNLNKMAAEFGIYYALWRPEEININEAWQLVDLLIDALCELRSQPDRAKAFNPSNGWGDYEGFLEFVADYLEACRKYPKAKVRACR